MAALFVGAHPTFAEEQRDPGGSLNPEEMTVNAMIARAARGESSMVVCMQAYFAIKSADYEGGKTILDACSDEFTAAMHWQSYMEHNGLEDAIRLKGAGYDPAEVTPDADDWRYESDGKHF